MKKYAGEEFLNRLYKDLVHSDEVVHTAKGANKNEDLAIYLERLERITKEARDKDRLDLLKHFYYKKYIIKEEDVPESYFENLEQIALARGYGHIIYDEQTKQQEIDSIISEQKASLDSWLEYFVSDDTKHYPMWFKYYVFQNVMKIGYFDKEKNEFTKRTSSTVKPFIEINREALAMLYDELYKYLDNQEITDTQLEQLIKNGSFVKIYSYIQRKLDEVKKTNSTSNEGIWKKYKQGSNPEVLFNDIHGKGTGWCTAGGLETATSHLEGGDFHVYYTKDEHGEYTNPRIAIRMEARKIAEIRGIAQNQNLENEMENIVEEKLKEFPDKEEYKKKVSDMKILTTIYNKYNNKEELTKEELIFLYEIDSKIIGFGYETDPRIEEIKNERNIKKDLSIIFGLSPKDISINDIEALEGDKKLHYGNLDYSKFPDKFDGITLPKEIIGSLNLDNLTTTKGLILPEKINGDLCLRELTDSKNLILPKYIGGSLLLSNLKSAKGIVFPEEIYGTLHLASLTSTEGLALPKIIHGHLCLNGLTSAKSLILPDKVGGDLELHHLISAEGLVLPKKLNKGLFLDSLTSVEGLKLPKIINGSLCLQSLTSAKGLELPEVIMGSLELHDLISCDGLVLPKKIELTLNMLCLENPEGIVLPKNEKGEIYVPWRYLSCFNFTDEELIEAAKRTEARQKEPKIFEEIDDLSTGNPKK